MRVFAGDDTGLVKGVTLKSNTITFKYGKQGANNGVQHLIWSGTREQPEQQMSVYYTSGIIESFRSDTSLQLHSFPIHSIIQPSQPTFNHRIHPERIIVGLDVLGDISRSYITCMAGGDVHVTPWEHKGINGGKSKHEITSFNVGPNVTRTRLNPAHTHMAVGGKEHLLQHWDLETRTITWKSRNQPHDFLDLRVPVWITDLTYIHSDPNLIVTGTAHHQVRLYDIRIKGNRAVWDVEMGEHAVISVTASPDGKSIIAGDGTGRLQQMDRINGRMLATFHGIGGSIRSVSCHPTLPLVASCGLDRFIRVYDLNTHKIQHKIYAKQKLNVVLWSSQLPEKKGDEKHGDDEQVWEELDTITQQKQQQKGKKGEKKEQVQENKGQDQGSDSDDDDDDADALEDNEADDDGWGQDQDQDEKEDDDDEDDDDGKEEDDDSDDAILDASSSEDDAPPPTKNNNNNKRKQPAPLPKSKSLTHSTKKKNKKSSSNKPQKKVKR